MKQEQYPNNAGAHEAARYLARLGNRDNRPVPAIGQSGYYPGMALLQRLRKATEARAGVASRLRIAASTIQPSMQARRNLPKRLVNPPQAKWQMLGSIFSGLRR